MSDPVTAPQVEPHVSEPPAVPPATLPPNVAASLACVFPLIGGLILINLEKKNPLVRFHAMQSIYFGGASAVIYVVFRMAEAIIGRIPLLGSFIGWLLALIGTILALIWLSIYVVTIWKSITGKIWLIPYIGPLARQQLEGRLL